MFSGLNKQFHVSAEAAETLIGCMDGFWPLGEEKNYMKRLSEDPVSSLFPGGCLTILADPELEGNRVCSRACNCLINSGRGGLRQAGGGQLYLAQAGTPKRHFTQVGRRGHQRLRIQPEP